MAKLKRLDFEAWQYRIPDKALLMESQKLVEIDNLLLEAAERLSGITEFTTYAYTSQYEKMDEAVRIYDALIHLQEGVNNELQEIDNDFFLRLANGTDRKHQGPMEALSSIHMEDISIPNQAGITRQWVYYNTNNQRCLGEAEKKEELTFQDFLCYSKDTEYETVYNPIFQEIFQEQYELSGLTQDYTYIEYMDGLLKAGEFNHEMYKPVQEFLSAGLDIITFGAKPLIEAFVGEDLITGEQMTETERYLRAIEGIVGLVSFGSIWSKLGKIGIEGVTAELAIEVMSDTSSTITSTSMNELGANGIVSTVAGIIAGGITGSSINNAINTRVWSSHIETPEVPETPFQIQRETIQVEEIRFGGGEATDIIDNIKRIDEIEVEFNYNSKYDEKEFARQLAAQQKGMNELTVQEYLDNRQRYIEQGRAIEGNMAQQVAREKAFVDKVDELQQAGLSLKEAEGQAREWLDTQAALHNPDQVAGGYASNVDDVGDKGVNSSIGSQWRYRIDDVDVRIQQMAESMSEAEKNSTYLNVNLVYKGD